MSPNRLSPNLPLSLSLLCTAFLILRSIIPCRQQALFHLRREDIHIKIYGMPQELTETAEKITTFFRSHAGCRVIRDRISEDFSMLARVILIIYCIFINFLGIASMAADKIRAMERRFRIPEGVLFTIAIIGGSIGSILGMLLFHHKIRKASFRFGLPLILLIQIGVCILLRSVMASIVFM